MSWGANITNEVLGHTDRELASARATIAELEKRIGELEAVKKLDIRERSQFAYALEAYSAERQRREELESVVLMLEHDSGKTNEEINAAASAYVSKYLTPTPHPTQEQTP